MLQEGADEAHGVYLLVLEDIRNLEAVGQGHLIIEIIVKELSNNAPVFQIEM